LTHPPPFPTRRSSDLRIPAMDVEVAVEPAVGSRVADQNDGTVAALAVKDAIPAAGEWRREIDRGEMFGPWPGAERVHGVPGDPEDRKSTRLNSSHDQI